MNQFDPITGQYKPKRFSEADPAQTHAELAKEHGPYPRYEELMERYNCCAREMDVTGAIKVITEFDADMRTKGQMQYLPLIATLNARLTDFALEIARSGGGAR